MAAALLWTTVCCVLLVGGAASNSADSDPAQLLTDVNDVSDTPDAVSNKKERSIYAHAYPDRYANDFRAHGYAGPYQARPPFAAHLRLSGRPHLLDGALSHPDRHHGVKYAHTYHKYTKPHRKYPEYSRYAEQYIPPVYVPHSKPAPYTDFAHLGGPFHEAGLKVQDQFGPDHVPPHTRHLPLTPYPEYHPGPPPYAHELPSPTYEGPVPHFPEPAPQYDHAKAPKSLGHFGLDPTSFIKVIAAAYHENEKSFGHRDGKSYEPEYSPRHPNAYRDHESKYQPEYKPVHVPKYRPLHVPEYQAPHVPEYRPLHVPEYRPLHVPEYRPRHVSEYRPLRMPEYQAPHGPEYRPLRMPEYQAPHGPQHRGPAPFGWSRELTEPASSGPRHVPLAPLAPLAPLGSLYSLATANSRTSPADSRPSTADSRTATATATATAGMSADESSTATADSPAALETTIEAVMMKVMSKAADDALGGRKT